MEFLTKVENLANELMSKQFTFRTSGGKKVISAKSLGYRFKFDNAVKRFGLCSYKEKTIQLSKVLCLENTHQLEGEIKDTILHEIAHAFSYHLYGKRGAGHGHLWVATAKSIGCTGKRCWSPKDFGGVKQPEYKWTLKCPSCGKEHGYARKPKQNKSCGTCYPYRYNSKYQFELIKNW